MIRSLIVNDTKLFADVYAYMLKDYWGIESIVAYDLKSGLEEAQNSRVDIAFVDKNIGGHRGCQPILHFFQEQRPEVPLVLVSAEDGERARKELYCHEFISLPVLHEELRKITDEILKRYKLVK